MYAIMRTGGKQYRVKVGQRLKIEKIIGEVGSEMQFDEILMVASPDQVTTDAKALQGARVKARILEHGKGKKVTIIKFKLRKDYRRKRGHRQLFTEVQILDIAV